MSKSSPFLHSEVNYKRPLVEYRYSSLISAIGTESAHLPSISSLINFSSHKFIIITQSLTFSSLPFCFQCTNHIRRVSRLNLQFSVTHLLSLLAPTSFSPCHIYTIGFPFCTPISLRSALFPPPWNVQECHNLKKKKNLEKASQSCRVFSIFLLDSIIHYCDSSCVIL